MVNQILSKIKITQTLNSLHNWIGKPAQQLIKALQSGMQKKSKFSAFLTDVRTR